MLVKDVRYLRGYGSDAFCAPPKLQTDGAYRRWTVLTQYMCAS